VHDDGKQRDGGRDRDDAEVLADREQEQDEEEIASHSTVTTRLVSMSLAAQSPKHAQ
jgi:hypothetical protein